jgi:transposase
VGTLTPLTYVLTVEDPHRFQSSREAGAYFGLRPKQRESGGCQPQLGITKEGDAYVRKVFQFKVIIEGVSRSTTKPYFTRLR